jgi:hypothetical protein
VAFSPDGKRLAAGWGLLRDGNILVWNTTLGEQARSRPWIKHTATTIPPVDRDVTNSPQLVELR